jgi:hypothetical protein
MLPSHSSSFERAISKPRLDSYKGYFRTRSLEEAIGLYMWNTELSASLSNLLSLFEITLRNQVHRAMSLRYSPSKAQQSFAWYNTIRKNLPNDTQGKIDKVLKVKIKGVWVPRTPVPGPDEVVSRVTFGFWPAILSHIDARITYADVVFPQIFPNHPLSANPADWLVVAQRKSALNYIYEINSFRNRIAHHEPLWKFPAVPGIAESKNMADSLSRFARLLAQIDDAIQAMDSDLYKDMLTSSWRLKIEFLLSPKGILRYRTLNHCVLVTKIEPAEFHRNFHLLILNNRPVRIKRKASEGIFFPG